LRSDDPLDDPIVEFRFLSDDRDLVRLRDRDRWGRGQQPPDAERRAERPQDEAAGDQGDETRGADQEGSHRPDDSRDRVGAAASGSAFMARGRGTWKDPKEPTRGVDVDVIAAVSLRSAPPG